MQYFSTYQSLMVSAKSCDRCKRHAYVDDAEFHEFLSIDRQAGYGSVFGDGQQLKLDLCQHCVKAVLGDWMKISPNEA
ncbi:hypothetical protein [Providencia manganoxydans]|uniref:hypothetical protein n=1 Tax=Providencia manganoxydans TaxID=2923283 RepID=UPI0015984F94|nr:hypothetical protein G9394_04680 [Proteus vulgaris]QKJ48157.1 hypothetical protein G9394_04760 [Proteus vulgaris]